MGKDEGEKAKRHGRGMLNGKKRGGVEARMGRLASDTFGMPSLADTKCATTRTSFYILPGYSEPGEPGGCKSREAKFWWGVPLAETDGCW